MAKRALGEGSVYERADGKWIAEITEWHGPKRHRRKRVCATQREAVSKLKDLHALKDEGVTVNAERVTVAEWLTEWLEKEAKPKVRPRTLAGYQAIVNGHLIPALGNLRVRQLEPRHVRDYVATAGAKKRAKGKGVLSARSVQLHHAVLRAALVAAERHGIVSRNVARLAPPPSVKRENRSPLTPAQAQALIAATAEHPLSPLFRVAMGTGMRMSELLGLTWESVQLDSATIRVERTLQRYAGAYHLDAPKTEKSRRSIAVPAPVVDALRQQSTAQKADKLKAGAAWQGGEWGLVFANAVGGPLNGTVVTHAFQRALAKAELPRVRFHDLRHATATYLLAAGVDLKVVQEILGHSQIATTADVYAHVLESVQRDAADRLGAVLFSAAI